MLVSRGKLALGALVLVAATALLTYAATVFLYVHQLDTRLGTAGELSDEPAFQRLLDVIGYVRRYYVEDVPLEQLLEGAADGALQSLEDPYTVYYDAEAYEQFEINLTGEYEGIGVAVTEVEEYVVVQTPFPGSPGATTYPDNHDGVSPPGLRAGDRIIEVDGQRVVGVPVDHAAALIRGPRGTEVRLTVERPVEGADPIVLYFTIRREQIEIPTVQQADMVTPDIGYLWLTQFTPETPGQVSQALDRLREQGARAIILDLRNNPGGELSASVQVASEFVPEGPVVHVVRRGGDRETYAADGDGLGLPLVVLVNGGSASASEIVAGAIQDYGSGTLLGEQTFGKGSVQTVYTLRDTDDGTAAIKITTARYLTPKERSIDAVGLTPDVEVPGAPEQQGDPARDPQLQRAIQLLEQRLGG
ncbi:MAG TPA: S41 family peptidase [Bacillota bacterium]